MFMLILKICGTKNRAIILMSSVILQNGSASYDEGNLMLPMRRISVTICVQITGMLVDEAISSCAIFHLLNFIAILIVNDLL